MTGQGTVVWRQITRDRRDEFVAKGHRQRHFFPHAAYFLPRCGPDGYKLAVRMCGERDPRRMWELVLYADDSMLAEFPRELFFDDDLVWHRQQFGLPGQIATADVVLAGRDVWSMAHVADLVQRIGRRREHKTRIEKLFRGWHDMLLNALLAFAVEHGAERVHVPTPPLALANTDQAREKGPELFERLYDRDVNRLFQTTRVDGWWVIDVTGNQDRLVVPSVRSRELPRARTVCICHDIERGLGHAGVDENLAGLADSTWRRSLTEMLAVEREAGLSATYSVVGSLLPEVREEIEAGGHCIAFHSFDHSLDGRLRLPDRLYQFIEGPRGRKLARFSRSLDQLSLCRELDYRIKGYRPPQSRITRELGDERLLFHNFEWLASSVSSLGTESPVLRDRLVRIPVHLDDFDLYRGRFDFEAWQAEALDQLVRHDLAVVSLHDCYGQHWLPRYRQFLGHVLDLAEPRTLDDVAAEVTLAASC